MSKELQAFRKICRNLNSYEFTDEYKKNKKLIETALKEYENSEKTINDIFSENGKVITCFEIKKKLKALEEIERVVDEATWLNEDELRKEIKKICQRN